MLEKQQEEAPDDKARLFFGTGVVFDISQTDGEDLPDIEVPELHGDSHEGRELFARMEDFAERSGLPVRVGDEDLRYKQMGCYAPAKKEIVLRPAEPLQMVKTLAHELAHHLADSKVSDDESETIAEAVAYVVCSHFGLDTGARSFPYIAVWSTDKVVLKNALTTVQRISAKMIDGLRETKVDKKLILWYSQGFVSPDTGNCRHKPARGCLTGRPRSIIVLKSRQEDERWLGGSTLWLIRWEDHQDGGSM